MRPHQVGIDAIKHAQTITVSVTCNCGLRLCSQIRSGWKVSKFAVFSATGAMLAEEMRR